MYVCMYVHMYVCTRYWHFCNNVVVAVAKFLNVLQYLHKTGKISHMGQINNQILKLQQQPAQILTYSNMKIQIQLPNLKSYFNFWSQLCFESQFSNTKAENVAVIKNFKTQHIYQERKMLVNISNFGPISPP
eukprot:TRINITY_DN9452_c1_g1_i2.p1 TRINITY_DN9452_c1_g1~~TRINITY_DN9452_c1_g1_i2.p1  ORF type:complete len:132 (-),score=1.25 TRINITY_DN9452_c1_g1_i2:273-668(-)